MSLLELNGVSRSYTSEGGTVTALDNISLSIVAGEMIAIMGTSGSGKSTLMNILGCLDRPTSGSYQLDRQDIAAFDSDALAKLRRERFGFIFQRYHLLSHLSALGNIEIPAIYAGYDKHSRIERVKHLLARLGLADRATHLPNQLSGGQQQRVCIARALMNGGEIILADEPSGALDKASGREVINILKELHSQGHTIIIVTHDAEVASHAERIVEISDGRIVRDTGQRTEPNPNFAKNERPIAKPHGSNWAVFTQLIESLKMALHAIVANRMRSVLTMLGIIIGITSVVSIVALSQGAQKSMLKSLNEASGNGFNVYKGISGDEKVKNIRPLIPEDMEAISELPGIESVKPLINSNAKLRRHRFDISADLNGTGANVSNKFGLPIISGRDINEDDVRTHAQVVVIDYTVRDKLFAADESPLGQTIMVANFPCVVIGVTGKATGLLSIFTFNARAIIPYTTASSHLLGRLNLDGISVRVRDGWAVKDVQAHVQQLLEHRHGKKDFDINSEDSITQNINQIVQVATLVISLIGAISLVVGGVGIMNIMLVSVTERTREIGIRMAVGARQRDVQNQFLIESVTLCLVGGLIAIAITFALSLIVNLATDSLKMEITLISIIVAFIVSTLLGVIFGFLPARNAARLDPIEALARD
jgi:macrolide transport system ATP-binding/permease protein